MDIFGIRITTTCASNFGKSGSQLEVRPQGNYQSSDFQVKSMLDIENSLLSTPIPDSQPNSSLPNYLIFHTCTQVF